jgi:hypothetical protein
MRIFIICTLRIIKSRRTTWARHVAHTREIKNAYKILFGKPKEKSPLERPGHRWEGSNIKINFREIGWVRGCGLDSSGSGQRPMAGSCEHGYELTGSIKGGRFLDQLNNYQLLKEDFAPWS